MWNAELSMQPSDGLIKEETRLVWLKTTHQETSGHLFSREKELRKRSWLTGKKNQCDTCSVETVQPQTQEHNMQHLCVRQQVSTGAGKSSCDTGVTLLPGKYSAKQFYTKSCFSVVFSFWDTSKFPMKLNGQKKCFADEQGVSRQQKQGILQFWPF